MAREKTNIGHEPVEAASTSSATPNASSDSTPRAGGRRASRLADAETSTTIVQIRYPCLMNMDYHAAREAKLDRNHRWLMFAVIISGASAFIDAWPILRIAGPVIAVLAGTLDLTFDLSNRARAHAMLRRRYSEILAEAVNPKASLSEHCAKLDQLSGEEEPPFHAQMALSAMRAQEQAYGEIRDYCRPSLFYRIFANIVRFDGKDFHSSPGGRNVKD